MLLFMFFLVVVATTKVGIFKQITTCVRSSPLASSLLLLPQRQEFSSKSQLPCALGFLCVSCCCYHKGRNFQANHNNIFQLFSHAIVVVATIKVGIFKQITTAIIFSVKSLTVVVATTKVGIFKQITTDSLVDRGLNVLLLLPQRQEFSSKSQLADLINRGFVSCCCYHKGRNFQANHNRSFCIQYALYVVVATTKVGIFKQITTQRSLTHDTPALLLLPQRQEFSSKSQLTFACGNYRLRCCCYHKGRNFQANHNEHERNITRAALLLLPQRQEFSSKSQHPKIS